MYNVKANQNKTKKEREISVNLVFTTQLEEWPTNGGKLCVYLISLLSDSIQFPNLYDLVQMVEKKLG